MNVLVTGGAGYIGSHAVKRLQGLGHNPVIYDNLSRGNEWALLSDSVIGDIRDGERLIEIFKKFNIEVVMHFAALAYVGESVEKPEMYFDNNISGGINLINSCLEFGIKHFIFSSSCAVYGLPSQIPIDESHSRLPISPYGETKLAVEKVLDWYDRLGKLKHVSLRYFNVAGCDTEGEIGEWHSPETHIIPNVLLSSLGLKPEFRIFGDDYDTPDGTCIRDYVHVADLVEAHVLAMERLMETGRSEVFNLGNSRGFSVKEIVEECEKVTGAKINVATDNRRQGDPPVLVSDSKKVRAELGWRPAYSGIETIIQTHWDWLKKAKERGICNS
ncbi:MAG: UDP-glucose 4-epimerase GalE [Candidatus Dadabacteria bacterium]|nr:UDP-glucose 4-epimerase GalE [Candidatus Dadabacteria bacterium]